MAPMIRYKVSAVQSLRAIPPRDDMRQGVGLIRSAPAERQRARRERSSPSLWMHWSISPRAAAKKRLSDGLRINSHLNVLIGIVDEKNWM